MLLDLREPDESVSSVFLRRATEVQVSREFFLPDLH